MKYSRTIIAFAAIACIIGAALLVLFLTNSSSNKNNDSTFANSSTSVPVGYRVEPFQGGRLFRNEQFGYTFVLPPDWVVASYATVQDFAAFDPRAASQNKASLELVQGMKFEIGATTKDGRSFDDYIASVKTAQPKDAVMQSLTLGGVRAWRVSSNTPTKTVSTYFDSAANTFMQVTGYFPEEDQQSVYLQTYDTIVRSVAMP